MARIKEPGGTPPPIYERPAPRDRHKRGKKGVSTAGDRGLQPVHAPPPPFVDPRNDVITAKVAAWRARQKALVAPASAATIARQSALKNAGAAVVVDGHAGPRTRFNWAQQATVVEGARETVHRAAKGMWRDRATLLAIENMKHGVTAAQARQLAVKVGLPGAAKGSLAAALEKGSAQLSLEEYTRTAKDHIEQARPGTFGPGGRWEMWHGRKVFRPNRYGGDVDALMAARLAVKGVKPGGLAALTGDELLWIWNNDGKTFRRQFTTSVNTGEGVKSLPGEELTRGMQHYARSHGEDTKVDGKLTTHSVDAFLRAARREQDRREKAVTQEAKQFYSQGGAWETAARAVGYTFSFEQAWKIAGQGGTDPRQVEATHVMIAASLLARNFAAENLYQRERQRAYDQGIYNISGTEGYTYFDAASGTTKMVRADNQVGLGGVDLTKPFGTGYQKSPWQGTPFGISPGQDPKALAQLREQAPADPTRTPPWLAQAMGVPELYAQNQTLADAEAYTRLRELDELMQQRRLAGTQANEHLVAHTTKVQYLVRNADGSVKMKLSGGQKGHATRTPVYSTVEYQVPGVVDVVGPPGVFQQAVAKGTGWLSKIPDTEGWGFANTIGPAVGLWRNSEYLIHRFLKDDDVSHELFIRDSGFSPVIGDPVDWHGATQIGWHVYNESPVILQFTAYAVFDPLNFIPGASRGAALFARSAHAFARADLAEDTLVRTAQYATRAVDSPIMAVAGYANESAAAVGRHLWEMTPAPIRGQFASMKEAREQMRLMLEEARSLGWQGTRVDEQTLERLRRTDAVQLESLQAHEQIGSIIKILEHFGADVYLDLAQTRLSEAGEHIMRLLMAMSEPGQLKRLADMNPEAMAKGLINDQTLALALAGGSFGSHGSFVAASIRKMQAQVRAGNERHVLQVLSRHLRKVGDYQFVEHPTWKRPGGYAVSYYPGADDPTVGSFIGGHLTEAYNTMRGEEIDLENPGLGQQMSSAERNFTVSFAASQRADYRMAGFYAEARRNGELVDEMRARSQRAAYLAEETEKLEALMPSMTAMDENDVKLLQAEMDAQVERKRAQVLETRTSLQHARNARRNLLREQAQVLLTMMQGSLHLQVAARRAAPKEGLDLAAVGEAGIGELTRQQADEQAMARVKKSLHTYLGGTFDVSSLKGLMGTGDRLKSLEGIFRTTAVSVGRRLKDLGIDPAFDARIWEGRADAHLAQYADSNLPEDVRIERTTVGPQVNPRPTSGRMAREVPGGGFYRRHDPTLGRPAEVVIPPIKSIDTLATALHELGHGLLQGTQRWRGIALSGIKQNVWEEVLGWTMARRIFHEQYADVLTPELIERFDERALSAFSTYVLAPSGNSYSAGRMLQPAELDEILADAHAIAPEMDDFLAAAKRVYEDASLTHRQHLKEHFLGAEETQASEEAAAQLIPQSELDWWEDIMGTSSKLQEDTFRKVLARMMIGDFQREGLLGDVGDLKDLEKTIAGVSRSVDLRDLVSKMPWKHSTVMAIQGQLDRLIDRRNLLLDQIHSVERLYGHGDQLHGLKAQLEETLHAEQRTSDQLYSSVLALRSRVNMEKIVDRAQREYAFLISKPNPTDAERALALARRIQIRKIGDYLESTRASAEVAESSMAGRALTRQKRAIGDADAEIRRQERLLADHTVQLRAYESRPKVQQGVRGFVDMRPTVRGRFNQDMATKSSRMGIVGSHHDILHYSLSDPQFRGLGRMVDEAGQMIQRRLARADLLKPSNYMSHLYVYKEDFKDGGRFVGEVHGEHGTSPEGRFVPHEGPDTSRGPAILLNDLSQDQLFAMLASEHIQPSTYLRHEVARRHAADRAQQWVSQTRGASGMVTMKQRGPMPPELANAVRDAFDQHAMAHKSMDEFDYGVIDQMARENPRWAEQIKAAAIAMRARIARIDYEAASRDAEKQALPQMARRQGRFAKAFMVSNNRFARMLWNRWDAIMSTWRFWVMAGNPAYHAMNHLGDLGRALMMGALTPQDLIIEHVGLAERLLYLLVKVPVQMLYFLAGHFDNQFATGAQKVMRDLLRWVEGAHHSVQRALFGAQDLQYPEELMAMGESRANRFVHEYGDDDPFDAKRALDEYRQSKRPGFGVPDPTLGDLGRNAYETGSWGDVRLLQKALGKTMWHMLGDAPEMWRRRAVYRSSYNRRMWQIELERPDMPLRLRQEMAAEEALAATNEAVFDYNNVPVILENLRLLVPFPSFTYKMAALTPKLAAKHPWLFPAVWRLENQKDPVTGEVDPLAGYVDVTWVLDPLFEALGLDHYAAKGIGFNVTQLADFRRTYKSFMGQPNPHLAPEAGGKHFVNKVVGYLDQAGLGLNPYIRSGLQATDLMHSEAWRTIFPQTSMAEAISREWWDTNYPNGLNLERYALDPVYKEFHEGTSLTKLREQDLVYYTNVEVARQLAEGLEPDYAKARHDVEGFLGFAAVFQLISGLWVRRLNPADHDLIRIGEMAHTDFEGLSPHQQAVNAIYRLRGHGQEAVKRGIEAYPYIEAYYRLSDWRQRNQLLHDHPEVGAYVQWTRLRKVYTDGTKEMADRNRRSRDRVLSIQAGAIGRMYGLWKGGGWDSTIRERFYQAMMTPELEDYFARHATPQALADKFVLGEFHGYMHKVSQAFHDIPEKDFKAKQLFMDRNPWLADYWQATGKERKDAEHLMNGIDASYRAWYFTVLDAEGFDKAAPILEDHPYMFDRTSAANRVDRYLGQWVPKDAASIAEHAADYQRMKKTLDAYFELPKGQARLDFTAGHPALAAYFKKYGAERHMSRRFRRHGHFRRFRFAAASNPFLAKRVDFWHRFFSLKPDKRLKFLQANAGDSHIFAWGPTADSVFTAQAHGFSFGKSSRSEAYRMIAPLLTLYFELKPEDRQFFLSVNPEVQMYFDQFSTSSPTGDPKLDKVLEKFFALDNPDDKQALLDKNPGLQTFFDSKRTTPEAKALGVMLDAYFGLPKGVARKMYLLTHPELQGFFDKRKDEHDLEQAWLDGLVDADPRVIAFQKTIQYEQALDEVRIRRDSLHASSREGRHRGKLTPAGRRKPVPQLVRDERLPGD